MQNIKESTLLPFFKSKNFKVHLWPNSKGFNEIKRFYQTLFNFPGKIRKIFKFFGKF